MLKQFQNHIHTNLSFLQDKKLLLAVSGGIDSMVLLDLFYKLRLDFAVAHCNFQLRGKESDDDEMLVIQTCQNGYIPYFLNSFDTLEFAKKNKLSVQLTARKLRYDWFYELIKNQKFDYIITAHHLDDSLETFLINFTRGSGLNGLLGIPQENDKIIRPMLIFSREEIENFAKENNIKWREDSSNSSDKYLRNKLRHDVIPVLKELNTNLLQSFENTLHHLKQTKFLADEALQSAYSEVVFEDENQFIFDLGKLLKYQNHEAYLFGWLSKFGFSDWKSINDLVESQSGKQVFSPTHTLLKNRNSLVLFPRKENSEEVIYQIEKGQIEVKVPLKLTFCNTDNISVKSTNVIFVDEEKLQFPLLLRKWNEGDIFYPFGMKGKKKLSKFFKDEKLSLPEKSSVWLLCSNDKIVWIIGKRQDERFKVTENTTKILKINYEL